ncbi:signal transduction histidine kinase [Microbacteriaceae bacterium SG_E_30_P1]|uniref:histidine kinase n=1 Tax=Antiquaquibacter oligotrophicus TaxID=2880260 RepID=A0ABT6KQH4_9MICO|nr:HAMP domain-containing sensor histidine kinase [Antiquaquibacter oligotrophicus]MDH6182240.1 signal transduction histidine kinase [Antiquaquibacter oligotrophicus]UDF12101.1 HAMP domain-containing histidine kinase [Antiquaquibacter oligotrophicus]
MRRRLAFRTRLAIIITTTFVAAGAALLAVQYVVVQGLFASAVSVTMVSCAAVPPGDVLDIEISIDDTGCSSPSVAGVSPTTPVDAGTTDVVGAVLQQSQFLSDEIVGGLLVSSIVSLIVFAGIAAWIASWLARRSLDRIGEVTSATRDITEHDLDRRLQLPGPHDEIKELGDTIDEMLDRLQLAFAARDRFVANASHELRTPLTTTRTALEVPLEHGDVPETLEPAVRRAIRATEHSERLIAALLSLSRARHGSDDVEPVSLGAVVLAELEELDDTGDLTVDVDVSDTTVLGDTTLIARAVRNLLDNAIRHNVSGGWVRVRVAEGTLLVENSGATIDEESVALLTEPFYRGADSRLSGRGHGLGLAIVDGIAQRHGGSLTLDARPTGGLSASLRLPLIDA